MRLRNLIPPLPPLEEPAWRERTLLALILATVFVACYQPLWDPDSFWHLAVSREMWRSHHLVRTETFSFTALGAPWEDTEWLFHLFCYPLWKLFGEAGLSLATALGATAAIALTYRCVRLAGGDAMAFALYLIPVFAAFQGRARFRPDLASLILMAILVEGLMRWRPEPPRVGRFWIFASALICLWAQIHGGWAYGLLLLGATLAGLALDALRQGRLSLRYAGGLALTGLAPAAAVFVNPYTWRVPWFPVKSLLGFADPNLIQISEWERTPFAGDGAFFLVVTVGVALALLVRWRELTWRLVVPAWSQAALGWLWVRYTAFTVVALAPAAAWLLRRPLERPALRRAGWGLALGGALALGLYQVSLHPKNYELTEKYPVQEVAFLERNGVGGNIFNEYVIGGYLDWTAYPDRRVFMDGRYYPFAKTLQEYWQAHKTLKEYEAFLARFPFDIALYPNPLFQLRDKSGDRTSPLRGPTVVLFPRDEWALVYFGNYGMVLLKRSAQNSSVIARFEYRVLSPDDLPYLLSPAASGQVDRDALRREIERKLSQEPAYHGRPALELALKKLEASRG